MIPSNATSCACARSRSMTYLNDMFEQPYFLALAYPNIGERVQLRYAGHIQGRRVYDGAIRIRTGKTVDIKTLGAQNVENPEIDIDNETIDSGALGIEYESPRILGYGPIPGVLYNFDLSQ